MGLFTLVYSKDGKLMLRELTGSIVIGQQQPCMHAPQPSLDEASDVL